MNRFFEKIAGLFFRKETRTVRKEREVRVIRTADLRDIERRLNSPVKGLSGKRLFPKRLASGEIALSESASREFPVRGGEKAPFAAGISRPERDVPFAVPAEKTISAKEILADVEGLNVEERGR